MAAEAQILISQGHTERIHAPLVRRNMVARPGGIVQNKANFPPTQIDTNHCVLKGYERKAWIVPP